MTNPFKDAVAYASGGGYLISKQGVIVGELNRLENDDYTMGDWALSDVDGNIQVTDQYRNDIAELYEFTFRR